MKQLKEYSPALFWSAVIAMGAAVIALGYMTVKSAFLSDNPHLLKILSALAIQSIIPLLIFLAWSKRAAKFRKIAAGLPAVLDEVIDINLHIGVFIMFLILFVGAAFLLFIDVLPSRCTYEAVFGPAIVVGYFWFSALVIKAYSEKGMKAVSRYFGAFLGMLLLANIVDLTLIKLGAWYFSDLTNLCNIQFPPPLEMTKQGKEMNVPFVEIFGFNGAITWFIFFCGVFLNRLVDIAKNDRIKGEM